MAERGVVEWEWIFAIASLDLPPTIALSSSFVIIVTTTTITPPTTISVFSLCAGVSIQQRLPFFRYILFCRVRFDRAWYRRLKSARPGERCMRTASRHKKVLACSDLFKFLRDRQKQQMKSVSTVVCLRAYVYAMVISLRWAPFFEAKRFRPSCCMMEGKESHLACKRVTQQARSSFTGSGLSNLVIPPSTLLPVTRNRCGGEALTELSECGESRITVQSLRGSCDIPGHGLPRRKNRIHLGPSRACCFRRFHASECNDF